MTSETPWKSALRFFKVWDFWRYVSGLLRDFLDFSWISSSIKNIPEIRKAGQSLVGKKLSKMST